MRWRRTRSCCRGIRRPGDFRIHRTYIQYNIHIYEGSGGGGGVIERYIAAPNEVLRGRNRYHGYDHRRLSATAVSRHLHRRAPPQLYYCTAPALRSFCDARRTQTARAHTRAHITRGLQVDGVVCARDWVYECTCVRAMSVRVCALARMGGAGARPITAPNRGFYYCHRAVARRSPTVPRRPSAAASDQRGHPPRGISTRRR